MIVGKTYKYPTPLQEATKRVIACYAHNPYVIVGFEEDCARALESAHQQCLVDRRITKVVLVGTQECLESLTYQSLAYLAQKDVCMEFFMQVQNPFDNHILRQYGTLFCFKNAKSQAQSF